ncbi:hypothetical protein ElyMa_000201200 [Elysia marginata]|uniref:Uncharacterized protein n=1 Tax=Elysia marginata TaxID=1093978 RepID=A0AAV4EVY6_9GAST|nr:hypothetical protein ElyMa_000201200 [Elysia marginata]
MSILKTVTCESREKLKDCLTITENSEGNKLTHVACGEQRSIKENGNLGVTVRDNNTTLRVIAFRTVNNLRLILRAEENISVFVFFAKKAVWIEEIKKQFEDGTIDRKVYLRRISCTGLPATRL